MRQIEITQVCPGGQFVVRSSVGARVLGKKPSYKEAEVIADKEIKLLSRLGIEAEKVIKVCTTQ